VGPALQDPYYQNTAEQEDTKAEDKSPLVRKRADPEISPDPYVHTRANGSLPQLVPPPPHRNLSSNDHIKGFKTISKRVVTTDPTTGHKKTKVPWILDIDIEYDDPDNAIGDMCSWCRRVAENGDGQEYDAYYKMRQT
jgi:hypothetical protein